MKTKQVIATLAVLFAAGSALAGNADQSVQPTKTRAEVRAELEQAYKQGEIGALRNTEFVEYTNVASSKVRNETTAAAKQSAPATAGGN